MRCLQCQWSLRHCFPPDSLTKQWAKFRDLPGYGEMEREVTLVEVHGGDTIRVKDKIGHGTEWTGKLRVT